MNDPDKKFREHMVQEIDLQLHVAQMPTYTELRDALAQTLRVLPVRQMAPLLPVLEAAGGSLVSR